MDDSDSYWHQMIATSALQAQFKSAGFVVDRISSAGPAGDIVTISGPLSWIDTIRNMPQEGYSDLTVAEYLALVLDIDTSKTSTLQPPRGTAKPQSTTSATTYRGDSKQNTPSKQKTDWRKLFTPVSAIEDEESTRWNVPSEIEWKIVNEDDSYSGYIELTAKADSRRLGYALLEPRSKGVLWLELLVVLPPARRQGLGSRIITRTEELARVRGFKSIQGEVTTLCDHTPDPESCRDRARWFGSIGFTATRDWEERWEILKAV
jgi:GNAT superfamily N-acetyltransferase